MKFLSAEWADALKTELNANEAFRAAAAGKHATILQKISTADGLVNYWTKIEDGTIDLGVGTVEKPDATIMQSYDTAVALAQGNLNAATAFMSGKIRFIGNMGFLLGLKDVLSELPAAMRSIDVEY
jgi:putative sterol carrier protein